MQKNEVMSRFMNYHSFKNYKTNKKFILIYPLVVQLKDNQKLNYHFIYPQAKIRNKKRPN